VLDQSQQKSLLLTGDLYDGAYGKTIILIADSPTACSWLRAVFRELAHGGSSRTLTAEPEVQITNVETIELVSRPDGSRVTLRQSGSTAERSFVWSATPEGWLYLADLIQPLVEGGTGHQYLTEDKDDVALIELSSGEQDVLSAARSAERQSRGNWQD
jgi:hypothetical protein